MISDWQFECLDLAFRCANKLWDVEFGGLNVAACGDFFQCPPLPDEDVMSGKCDRMDYIIRKSFKSLINLIDLLLFLFFETSLSQCICFGRDAT